MCAASGARKVVAVTGSAGKTTTKEAVAAALGAKFNVLKSQGNLNNDFGLPLQLLRLEPEHEFAVVEMGMNHAGEIAALARIASARLGRGDQCGHGTRGKLCRRPGRHCPRQVRTGGVAARQRRGLPQLRRCLCFAVRPRFSGTRGLLRLRPHAPIRRLLESKRRPGRLAGEISRRGARGRTDSPHAGRAQRIERHGRTGRGSAKPESIWMPPWLRSQSLTAGDKRGQVIEIGGATILNDSYNSNPEALRSMIRTLAARPAGRRILVAGEMLEQGEQGPALHAACGQGRRRGRARPGGWRARKRRASGRGSLRGRSRLTVSARCRSRRPVAPAESATRETWCWSKALAACIWSRQSRL